MFTSTANSAMPLTLIHLAVCSKSRCLFQYLTDNNISFIVRDYITEPLGASELRALLEKLQLPAAAILRTTDPAFSPFKDRVDLEDDQSVIQWLCGHPEHLQRPILISGNRAVIGRPIEQALAFLKDLKSI